MKMRIHNNHQPIGDAQGKNPITGKAEVSPLIRAKRSRPSWLARPGWIAAAFAAVIVLVSGSYTVQADSYSAKVYASSLNVRSEPAAGAEIAGSVPGGTVVTVMDEQHGWLKIRSGRLTGWVAGYYLKKVSGSSSPATVSSSGSVSGTGSAGSGNSRPGTVTADSLRIRSGPGTGYPVVGSLKERDSVTVLSSRSGWLKIRTVSGALGWVADAYVSVSGSSASGGTTSSTSSARSRSGSIRGKTIVVDAGHGGDDPGMVGTTYGTMEKDLNLQTALYLRDYLKAAGAHVTMTRTNSSQRPSLSSRTRLTQSVSADAFVSIHFNSSPKRVSGTLTFFYSESDDLELARAIENQLGQGIGLKSNGVSFGNYYVLRENPVPASLVELGFLTSPSDESIVRRTSYQKKAAKAIAEGLADYFAQ